MAVIKGLLEKINRELRQSTDYTQRRPGQIAFTGMEPTKPYAAEALLPAAQEQPPPAPEYRYWRGRPGQKSTLGAVVSGLAGPGLPIAEKLLSLKEGRPIKIVPPEAEGVVGKIGAGAADIAGYLPAFAGASALAGPVAGAAAEAGVSPALTTLLHGATTFGATGLLPRLGEEYTPENVAKNILVSTAEGALFALPQALALKLGGLAAIRKMDAAGVRDKLASLGVPRENITQLEHLAQIHAAASPAVRVAGALGAGAVAGGLTYAESQDLQQSLINAGLISLLPAIRRAQGVPPERWSRWMRDVVESARKQDIPALKQLAEKPEAPPPAKDLLRTLGRARKPATEEAATSRLPVISSFPGAIDRLKEIQAERRREPVVPTGKALTPEEVQAERRKAILHGLFVKAEKGTAFTEEDVREERAKAASRAFAVNVAQLNPQVGEVFYDENGARWKVEKKPDIGFSVRARNMLTQKRKTFGPFDYATAEPWDVGLEEEGAGRPAPKQPGPEAPTSIKQPWEYTTSAPEIEGKTAEPFQGTMYRAKGKRKPIDDFKGIGVFAGSKRVAKNVAGGGDIVPIQVTLQKPFEMTNRQFRKHVGFGSPLRQRLETKGYDGIIVRYSDGSIGEVVLFEAPEKLTPETPQIPPSSGRRASPEKEAAREAFDKEVERLVEETLAKPKPEVKAKPNTLANELRRIGGVHVEDTGEWEGLSRSLYAQRIVSKKGGMPLDEAAANLAANRPEFGIRSGDDLRRAILDRSRLYETESLARLEAEEAARKYGPQGEGMPEARTEPTIAGAQTLIPGTEKRVVPTTPKKAAAQPGLQGLPLSAEQQAAAQEAAQATQESLFGKEPTTETEITKRLDALVEELDKSGPEEKLKAIESEINSLTDRLAQIGKKPKPRDLTDLDTLVRESITPYGANNDLLRTYWNLQRKVHTEPRLRPYVVKLGEILKQRGLSAKDVMEAGRMVKEPGAPYSLRPPPKESQYVSMQETEKWLRDHYFEEGKRKAFSRTTPAESYPWPIGTWRIDNVKLGYGRMIEQLREIPIDMLKVSEEDYTKVNYEGRGDDAKRYAEWIKAGKQPPPITVLETDDGNLLVSDGHRRLAAARLAGASTVLAWVSPKMETGKFTPEEKPIYVALTFEGSTKQAQDRAAVKEPGAPYSKTDRNLAAAYLKAAQAGQPTEALRREMQTRGMTPLQAQKMVEGRPPTVQEPKQRAKYGPQAEREFFDDLEKVKDNLRTTSGALDRAGRPGVVERGPRPTKTVASVVPDALKKGERVDFRGQHVKTAEDLAVMTQVLRDPRVETLYIFATKGDEDEVVGHQGISSRMPHASVTFVGSNKKMRALKEQWKRKEITKKEYKAQKRSLIRQDAERLKDWMQRLGADGYYLLHNHPSGSPYVSPEDVWATKVMTDVLEGFKGHVVIDTDSYSLIMPGTKEFLAVDVLPVPEGTPGTGSLYAAGKLERVPSELRRWFAGEDVNAKIRDPEKVAVIGKMLEIPDGFIPIVFVNAHLKVVHIEEIPTGLFLKPKRATEYIRGRVHESGSVAVFAYVPLPDNIEFEKALFDAASAMVKNGTLLDAVSSAGAYSVREAGVSSTEDYWMGLPFEKTPIVRVAEEEEAYRVLKKVAQVVRGKEPDIDASKHPDLARLAESRRQAESLDKKYRDSVVRATQDKPFVEHIFQQFEGGKGIKHKVAEEIWNDLSALDILTKEAEKLTGKRLPVTRHPVKEAILYRHIDGRAEVLAETWANIILGAGGPEARKWGLPKEDTRLFEMYLQAKSIIARENKLMNRVMPKNRKKIAKIDYLLSRHQAAIAKLAEVPEHKDNLTWLRFLRAKGYTTAKTHPLKALGRAARTNVEALEQIEALRQKQQAQQKGKPLPPTGSAEYKRLRLEYARAKRTENARERHEKAIAKLQARKNKLAAQRPDIAQINPDGMTARDGQRQLAQLREHVGKDKYRQFERVERNLGRFWNVLLNYVTKSGLISEDVRRQIRQDNLQHGDYLGPFTIIYRAAQRLGAPENLPRTLSVYDQDVIKEMVGTTSLNRSILQASVEKIYRTVQLVERNSAVTKIHDLRNLAPEMEEVVIDLKEGETPPEGYEKLYYYDHGQRQAFALPVPIARSVKNLDTASANWMMQAIAKTSNMLRLGAVAFSPTFFVRNPGRDYWTQAVRAKYPLNLLKPKDWAILTDAFLTALLGKNKRLYRQWRLYRGAYSGRLAQYRVGEAKAEKLLAGDWGDLLSANPLKLIKALTSRVMDTLSATEEMTRMVIFNKYLQEAPKEKGEKVPPPETFWEAGLESVEGTVDFRQHGRFFQWLTLIAPFTNARVQGTRTNMTGIGMHPRRAMMLGASAMAVAALLLIRNREETEDLIDEVPPYKRRDNWIFILGSFKDEDGKKKPIYITIPKGDFFRAVTVPVEDFLDYIYTNHGNLWNTIKGQVEEASPIDINSWGRFNTQFLPPFVRATIEVSQKEGGYKFYQERPIESQKLLQREPVHRYYPWTSQGARWLGEAMGWSPAKIDHFARAVAGEAGSLILRTPEWFGYLPEDRREMGPAESWSYAPMVRAFYSTQGGTKTSKLYDAISKAEQKKGSERFLAKEKVRLALTRWNRWSGAQQSGFLKSLTTQERNIFAREVKERQKGFGPSETLERRFRQLGKANGERAEAIKNIFNDVYTTPEERAAFLSRLADRKLLDLETVRQLGKMAEEGQLKGVKDVDIKALYGVVPPEDIRSRMAQLRGLSRAYRMLKKPGKAARIEREARAFLKNLGGEAKFQAQLKQAWYDRLKKKYGNRYRQVAQSWIDKARERAYNEGTPYISPWLEGLQKSVEYYRRKAIEEEKKKKRAPGRNVVRALSSALKP